ncbi:JAB domain-containing protein [Brevibacillus massiliensis]|uniref:JAB domain-containing protein n=1 Tax=Brevibacillus massiliensis TaxID=1118054 RepID=UPI0021C3F838|nr:JAB domain-containing protein [Brevibacillus massiliensis]
MKLQKVGSLPFETKPIHLPKDAAAIFQAYLGNYCHTDRENFIGMYLNTKNEVVGISTIHTGTLNASLVNPREVFTDAVLHKAASIILCHNHPSGNPSPSSEDITVTKNLQKAGKMLDIDVLDHIILGYDRFLSLKEQGLIDQPNGEHELLWENRMTKESARFARTFDLER